MIFIKKLVCLFNDYQNSFGIELFCFDCKFASTKLVKRIYFENIQNSDDSIKEQINDALSEIEFNKTSCVVNVSSHNIFTESIIVPKLNATEEHKACILKLQKSYKDDFEKQYFYTKTAFNLNKNNRRIDFLLLNKSKYKTIIKKINLLGLNVDKIVFNPATIGSFIAKKHIFSLDKVGLSVIINKSSVTLLVTKGNHLIDYIDTNHSLYGVYNTIAEIRKCELDEVIEDPFMDKTLEVELEVNKFIFDVIKEIKRIGFLKDFTISEYFIHSELGLADHIKEEIEKNLNIKFKSNIKFDSLTSSCFQAVTVLKNASASLPLRVK